MIKSRSCVCVSECVCGCVPKVCLFVGQGVECARDHSEVGHVPLDVRTD
jgi:hypothetical protein